MSRIPVGEALGRLRGQGLLVSDGRGRGLRLRQYSLDEIADFYDYRELLEGGAARAAARAASAADIDRLAVIHAQTVELGAAGRYESPEWYAADYGFHAALAEASHKERVSRAVKHLLAELHGVFYGPMYHRIAAARGRRLNRAEATRHATIVLREHQAIIAAVRSGDAELAERRARHHVSHALRRIRDVTTSLATVHAGDLTAHA